ncbi:radical SAM protein [Paludibacter sp. 221]|uniref:radical SAM protein n=1 Tax=Paludibacter sp. 221 TaxID=2302939 RepID=UPI0013D05EDA|nr:radical SAM protein [Paludibacter sp. 221]NDV46552.1 radical SAM protein [Paludibacter sp. 221]
MIKSFLYLPFWFVKTRIFGKKSPLQTVIFISDQCNLQCKHCCVYAQKIIKKKSYEQIKEELEYSYKLGSRFVDFEGGEPTMWKDGEHDLNSLIRLAKAIGFFSTTVTTNAVMPFSGLEADSIWVSLDGLGKYHDRVRGEGVFDKLVKNIETSGHPDLSVNMVVSKLNYESVDETIEFVKNNPYIKLISINFLTPYPGTEDLMLDWDKRREIIDKVIAYKKQGYPIMNSVSGLKKMKDNNFKKYCWVSNFIAVDGTKSPDCGGTALGLCDQCGYCMAGEMNSVMNLAPDTVIAGLKLRL